MNEHPKGNCWFAGQRPGGDRRLPGMVPWRVYLQMGDWVHPMEGNFDCRESAEKFIQEEILGAAFDEG